MIDYERVVSYIQGKCHCTRDDARTGMHEAFLQLDRTRTEAEQIAYLCNVGCVKVYNDLYQRDAKILNSAKELPIDDDIDISTPAFIAPEDIQNDYALLTELVRHVPDRFKVATVVVVLALLAKDRSRKPLTVEMTRQYIKRAKLPDSSEQARQVFTFLTTWRHKCM